MLSITKVVCKVRTGFQIPALPSPNGVILGKSQGLRASHLRLHLAHGNSVRKTQGPVNSEHSRNVSYPH